MADTVTTAPEYTEPCPGKKGTDRIWRTCGCGDGIFKGRFAVIFYGYNGQAGPWCFACKGAAGYSVLVSSVRATARRQHREAVARYEAAVEWEAGREAREAAELVRQEEAAAAEQARRDALVKGFAGEVGEKLTGLTGTVTVAKSFEVRSYSGYGTDVKMFVVVTLDNGQVVKTSGTGRSLYALNRGDTVTVGGTVKSHDEYEGQDQTVLTRAKITVTEQAADLAA